MAREKSKLTDEQLVMEFLGKLKDIRPVKAREFLSSEHRGAREALKAAYPPRLAELQAEHLDSVPSPCMDGEDPFRPKPPVENLLQCLLLCPQCLMEARRGLRHVLGILRGEDVGGFLDPVIVAARLQVAANRVDRAEAANREWAREKRREIMRRNGWESRPREEHAEEPHLSPTQEEILLVLLRSSAERMKTGRIATTMQRDQNNIGRDLRALVTMGFLGGKGRQGYALLAAGKRRAKLIEAERKSGGR